MINRFFSLQIGMIYTDLMDDGSNKGTVVCKRHAGSFFLSSAEVLFSAEYQTQYPTICKYSSSLTSSLPSSSSSSTAMTISTSLDPQPRFGSRFVTVVVSGNEEGGIDLSCYQVSNVGCAMARDGVIEASVEPGMMVNTSPPYSSPPTHTHNHLPTYTSINNF
jgi:nuclear protein localization family protein 4